jgi:hypothetical protein
VCELLGRSPHYGWQQGPNSHAVCCINTVARISGLPGELLKSHTQPAQELAFLGLNIDSSTEELSLPHQKLSEIWKQNRKLLRQTWVSAREIAQFVGKLSATVMAIHNHYRSLQHLKHQALRGSQNYSSLIRMSQAAKEDLEMEREESSGHSARVGDRDRRLPDKVSAYCQGNLTGGRWSEEEQSLHINELELLA